jgi:hypothetical protein
MRAIPDAHCALYVEHQGKFVLDAEGVEDVGGLKSALDRLKTEKKQLQGDIERFKGIDPEKYQELVRAQEEAEAQKLKQQGKHEELFAERLKKVTGEHEQERTKLTNWA